MPNVQVPWNDNAQDDNITGFHAGKQKFYHLHTIPVMYDDEPLSRPRHQLVGVIGTGNNTDYDVVLTAPLLRCHCRK